LTPREATRRLAEGQVAAGWWLAGPDAYFGEQVLTAVGAAMGGAVERMRVEGRADPAELALWLSTQSFFGEPRLLVWRDVDGRVAAGRAMDLLWAAMSPRSVLVCWNDRPGAPPTGAPITAVDLAPLRGPDWTEFVRARARDRGVMLTPAALTLVAEATAPSGHQVDAVLDRLGLVFPAGHLIGDQVAAEHVPPGSPSGMFPLIAAIMGRDAARGVRELDRQLAQGTAPLVLVVTLARQMMLLERYLAGRERGEGHAALRRAVDARPWQWNQAVVGARQWTRPEAAFWLERAARVDQAMKHSQGDEQVWLTSLVLLAARRAAYEADPARALL
jgi:DNA polymerase III delta subunit